MNNSGGVLTGYAWSENGGWVSFSCVNTGSCGTATYGVTIDPDTGFFSGNAWAENFGWISFESAGLNPFQLKTSWTCTPLIDTPALDLDNDGADAELSWTAVAGATAYDAVRGDLSVLRTTLGDFATATDECLANNEPGTTLTYAGNPPPGEGYWFLVRGADCGGGSWESGGAGQVGLRDPEVEAAVAACP